MTLSTKGIKDLFFLIRRSSSVFRFSVDPPLPSPLSMPQRKGKKKGNVVVHQEVEPWDFIPASVQREMEEEERQRSNQNSEGREQESAVSPTSEGNSDVIPSTSKSFGYKDLSDQIKKSKKAKKQGKRHQQQCEEDERIKQIKASAPSKRDIETSAISSFLQSRGLGLKFVNTASPSGLLLSFFPDLRCKRRNKKDRSRWKLFVRFGSRPNPTPFSCDSATAYLCS